MSIIKTAFATLLLALLMAPIAIAKEPFTLDNIHKGLQSRYEGVSHMSPTQLQKALSGPNADQFLVLDSRETSEFAVSHIKGAKQVDPSIWRSSFMRKFAALAKGKTVVIYCSVGERSSKLAKYVQQALMKQGATGVYNLQGGIFKWHNDQRKMLIDSAGSTKFVHPYNKHWGKLVQRDKLLRYSPK